jgi:hypothetical protein
MTHRNTTAMLALTAPTGVAATAVAITTGTGTTCLRVRTGVSG